MLHTHLQPWTTTYGRMAGLLAAVLIATTLSVANAPAARAYTCPPGGARTITLNDGSAAATIYVAKNCSDGRSRFSGNVRDVRCDGRAAYLQLSFFNNGLRYRYQEPSAGNGCGTSATFSYSSTNPAPEMKGCARAWNRGPTQSTGDCEWF